MDAKRRRLVEPQPSSWPAQKNRERRGHDFYPDASIPSLGSAGDVAPADRVVHARYFLGESQWWITEADVDSGDAFGYTVPNGDEEMAGWGYVSLPELEQIRVGPMLRVVERDVGFAAMPARESGIPLRGLGLSGQGG